MIPNLFNMNFNMCFSISISTWINMIFNMDLNIGFSTTMSSYDDFQYGGGAVWENCDFGPDCAICWKWRAFWDAACHLLVQFLILSSHSALHDQNSRSYLGFPHWFRPRIWISKSGSSSWWPRCSIMSNSWDIGDIWDICYLLGSICCLLFASDYLLFSIFY